MLRKSIVACALFAVVAVPAAAQTADDIIAKSFAAQGGIEKLKAMTTVRMTGRMVVGPGMEAPIVLEIKRPKSMRVDISIQGMTIVQAFDGADAWMLNPIGGGSTAELLPSDMKKMVEEQADLDGPLMDYKAKGHTVELLGKETAEGTECFKLKVTEKDGDVTVFYVDTETYLTVRQEARRTMGGVEVDNETIIGDWKDVGGMLFPHAIDSGQKGAPQRQKMTIEKIEVNVPIDDARFKMPK
jgi:outer membrane lipoprotein-sorting protein